MAGSKATTPPSALQESATGKPSFRLALYSRVSTTNNQDTEVQLYELREHAGHRGWQIVGHCLREPVLGPGISDCRSPYESI